MMKNAAITMKLLDIFGNAQTPANLNSSRFIKFLKVLEAIPYRFVECVQVYVSLYMFSFLFQIKYNSKNEASSINISYQLLEISRLCGLTTFGSNFHIFYLLTFNATKSLKDSLGLKDQIFKVSLLELYECRYII